MIAAGTAPAGVVDFSMALLSFADSAPRAYRLKAGNAYLTFSTSAGTFPLSMLEHDRDKLRSLSLGNMLGLPSNRGRTEFQNNALAVGPHNRNEVSRIRLWARMLMRSASGSWVPRS
jgi:hypothetical protein